MQVSPRIRRWYWRFVGAQAKVLITYFVLIACGAAINALSDVAPVLPFSYHTALWLLALLFPALAVSYSMARLRVRRNEIINVCRRDRLWRVYFPGDQDGDIDFEKYVQKRLGEYYGLWEFAGYSLLAGAIAFTVALIVAGQFQLPRNLTVEDAFVTWDLSGPTWAILVGSAFLGAYSGSVVLLLRRYRSFDLRPTTFLQVAVVLVAGTLAGAFITVVFAVPQLGTLAFIVAFLSAINVTFLSDLMRSQFARLTNTPLPPSIPSDLPEMIRNAEAVEGLNRISVYSIRELAVSDPIRLYFNVPQELAVILDMIDEAVLRTEFSDSIAELKQAHINRFTQLVLRLGPEFKKDETTWPPAVSVVDDGGPKDTDFLRSCDNLLKAGSHHRLLGFVLYNYREAYF